jgi:hypothetical protein
MRIGKSGVLCAVFVSALFFVGCGGGSGGGTTPPTTLTITTTSPLTVGVVSSAYSVTLAATGGTPPYSWSVSSGTLPAGLSLSSSGVISGTPTAAGSTTFSLQAKDSATSAQTATLAATQVINPALAITTTSPLTPGIVGTAYSTTFAASGGVSPYTWALASGSGPLPAGLTLSTAGVLSGTPTAAFSGSFNVQVSDSETTAQKTSLSFTLSIVPAVPALAITTTSPLTAGTVGLSYSLTLAASGGTAPYSWSVSSGSLPAGLTLSAAGVLSGTPTSAGTSNFTLQATDSGSPAQTATLAATLVIGSLTVSTSSLPAGNVGSAYTAQLAVKGGVAPYTWSLASGTLPAGISLSSTGLVSGTPGSVSSSAVAFTVKDSTGATGTSASLTLAVNAATGTVPDSYYTFVFAGTAPQGATQVTNGVAMNGIIKIQAGQVVSGFFDQNTNTSAPVSEQPLSGGTLVLGANGLGQLVLTTASNTMTFALASPASVTTGGSSPIRMIEYDDASGTGSRGSGVIDPAPAAPTTGGISGNFAFLLSGTDPEENQQALVGSFLTDGAGNITSGEADANQVLLGKREAVTFTPITGKYAVDANGRGTFQLILGGASFNYTFYEVSPTEWLVISLQNPLVSGFAYQQTAPAGGFTVASLPPTSILEASGVSAAGPDISLGLASSDGAGNLTFTYDEYNGALTSGNTLTAAFTVDPVIGRAIGTTTGSQPPPILYLINSNTAFYLEGVPPSSGSPVVSSGQSGILEAQSGSPFTNASFSGNYLGGSLPLILTSTLNESGLVAADGAGNVNFTTNRSSSSGLVYQNDVVVGTYAVDSTGRGVITASDGLTRIFYVVSPTKIAFLTSDTGGYLGTFQQ